MSFEVYENRKVIGDTHELPSTSSKVNLYENMKYLNKALKDSKEPAYSEFATSENTAGSSGSTNTVVSNKFLDTKLATINTEIVNMKNDIKSLQNTQNNETIYQNHDAMTLRKHALINGRGFGAVTEATKLQNGIYQIASGLPLNMSLQDAFAKHGIAESIVKIELLYSNAFYVQFVMDTKFETSSHVYSYQANNHSSLFLCNDSDYFYDHYKIKDELINATCEFNLVSYDRSTNVFEVDISSIGTHQSSLAFAGNIVSVHIYKIN